MPGETASINKIKEVLRFNKYIGVGIAEGDKTPLHDGSLFIYNKPGQRNSDWVGEIRVQVKSKIIKNNNLLNPKFDISKEYLNYFKRIGGIFFLVYVAEEREDVDKEILTYKVLLPSDCKEILDSMNKDQKTKSVDFKVFPSDEDEQLRILRNINTHIQKQIGAIDPNLFYLKDVFNNFKDSPAKLSFLFNHRGKKDPNMYDIINELSKTDYLYVPPVSYGKSLVAQPIKGGLSIIPNIDLTVIVDDKIYFDNARLKLKKGKEYIVICDGIEVSISNEFDSNLLKFDLKDSINLQAEINRLKFLKSWIEYGTFHIPEIDFWGEIDDREDEYFTSIDVKIKQLNSILNTLENYGVTTPLNLDSLNSNFDRNYTLLTNKIKKDSINFTKEFKDGKTKSEQYTFAIDIIELGNLNIGVRVPLDESLLSYTPISIFKYLPKLEAGNFNIISALYSMPQLLYCDNMDYKYIMKFISDIFNQKEIDTFRHFLLFLITSFDSKNRHDDQLEVLMIDLATYLYGYNQDDNLDFLNLMQVKKRLEIIGEDEINRLKKMRFRLNINNVDDKLNIIALEAILGDKEVAIELFRELDDVNQGMIKEWPIYFLMV